MSEPPDDPWERARATQQADVAAALARRERRCPACGAPQRAGGRTCVECGADLTARDSGRGWRRNALIAGIAVAVVAAAAFPLISSLREDAAGERARAAQRQAALERQERARLREDARPVRAEGPPPRAAADPLAHRGRLVARGAELIAADARRRAAAGRLDGTIRGASCDPFPTTEARQAAEQDPGTARGRYECVAYTSKFAAPEGQDGEQRTGLFGYPYWLVLDYERSALVWCKVTPRAGEGGRSLASVPVPVPCRDPSGPG